VTHCIAVFFPGLQRDETCSGLRRRDAGKFPTRFLWHEQRDLSRIGKLLVCGWIQLRRYLRCGAQFARFLRPCSRKCGPLPPGWAGAGICNGFQGADELGLATAGPWTRNRRLHFLCEPATPQCPTGGNPPLAQGYAPGRRILYRSPMAKGATSWRQEAWQSWKRKGTGGAALPATIPRPIGNVAGLCNPAARSGLMPIPEAACDPCWRIDGSGCKRPAG